VRLTHALREAEALRVILREAEALRDILRGAERLELLRVILREADLAISYWYYFCYTLFEKLHSKTSVTIIRHFWSLFTMKVS
jgi:hypothetical protein